MPIVPEIVPVSIESVLSAAQGMAWFTSPWQHTIAGSVEQSGIGLHSGQSTTVTLHPAPESTGRYFVRVDVPHRPVIPAHVTSVHSTQLSTELAADGGSVRTVEHLLAALAGLGVDNVRIEINGPEVPLLDGSAWHWIGAIASVGVVQQSVARSRLEMTDPIWVRDGDAFVVAMPAAHLRLTYGIDFDVAAIGQQCYSWSPYRTAFHEAIAPARTFGLAHQIEQMRQAGLIKGGSLENALVCGNEGWLNPPLRFSNEPVRHKLLDLIGDLSLLGALPAAHITAYKASHRLHTQLARQMQSKISSDRC